MKQRFNFSRRRLWLWPTGRNDSPISGCKKWLLLLVLLVTAVTGVKAGPDCKVWEDYCTHYPFFGEHNSVTAPIVFGSTNGRYYIEWKIVLLDDNGDDELFSNKSEKGFGLAAYIKVGNQNEVYIGNFHCEQSSSNNNSANNRQLAYYENNVRKAYWMASNGEFTHSKISLGGTWTITDWEQNTGIGDIAKGITVRWYIPFELLNTKITIHEKGAWYKSNSDSKHYDVNVSKTVNTSYTFTVPTISWNTDYSIAADGTVTVPYTFSGTSNTAGKTHIATRINGVCSSEVGYRNLSDHTAGSYTFNLSDIDMNMRSGFSIQPYIEFTHENDKDANNGTKQYQNFAAVKNFLPLPVATGLTGTFSQVDKKVNLQWTGTDQSNYSGGKWAVYCGDEMVGTVDQTSETQYSYDITSFENESNLNYTVYYVKNGWSEDAKRSELASNTTTVNTTRSVPVNNLQAVSSENKVTLTWTSVAFPAGINNKFDIYVGDVKVATITPAEGQTTFKWEHRDDDQATERTNYDQSQTSEPGLDAYSVEDLDACTMYTYRVVGQIDDKELNSAEQRDKAIGAGTTFENFVCSKGENQGSVLLTWNVKRLGNQLTAENYVIERRVLSQEDNEDAWQKLTTLDSDKTFMTWEDKTTLPGVFYEYRITCYNYCENGNRPTTTTTDTGFAMSSGVVSGRITYGTGTAVSDVKVTLRQNNEDGEMVSHMHSLQFTGTGTGMLCTTTNKDLKKLLGGDFTIQAYVNPNSSQMSANGTEYMLYDASGVFSLLLKYDESANAYQLGAYINGENRFTDQNIPANKWSHVSCVYKKSAQTTTFFVTTDADHIATGTISSQSIGSLGNDLTMLALANNITLDNANNFGGYLDEFRFFKRALTQNEIAKNFNHPMGGTESDLAIYYPMDENMGVQSIVYDFSKSNNTSNGHHATAHVPALSSDFVPTEEQLSLMGLTDGQGNYVIRGVPFSGEGTNYTVIPTMGIHEFSPAYLSRYVSASSLVHNSVDFEDVSSFPVSGTVRYANTDYPVEDCYIYVDGQMSAKNGEPITTNAHGEFTVSVPIGDHFIEVRQNGHTFAAAGRYPADPNKLGLTHTFDQKITGLEFVDETLVNFTGRVVGGSIEGEKPVGFGLSQNNIGVAELVLSPLNELYRMNVVKNVNETTSSLDTNTEELPVASATTDINSSSWRGATADYCKKIYIQTDPSTGEFSAMLPPLQYKVESIKVVKTNQDLNVSTTIDLSNPQRTQTDSVRNEAGELLEYEYNTMLRQVYHSTPSFSVTQKGSTDGHFGIEKYKIKDAIGEVAINDIYSVDNGTVTYKYGGAVFVKDDPYTFELSGYEEYTNSDEETPVTSRVPLSGVVVTINNALSNTQGVYVESGTVNGEAVVPGQVADLQSNQMELNDEGYGTYTWTAGLPNITSPFTRTINMSYDIDGRSYQWSGITGIILGEMPTGNNFVTEGPDELLMILRDPPGSSSSAEWSSGTTVSKSTMTGDSYSETFSNELTIKFGYSEGIITGTPAVGTVKTVDSDDDLTIGTSLSGECVKSNTKTTTTTITTAISTKGKGDVFIGNSTNLVFGKARNLCFQRDGGGETVKLDVRDIISTGMRFGTMFNYSLSYIEDELFPNLIAIRNDLLTTTNMSQTEIDAYVNTGNEPVYLTTLSQNDENFGEKGTYTFVAPRNKAGVYSDKVEWANLQIKNWTKYLELNEKEKVLARTDATAVKNKQNHSFDSGSDLSYSVETETEKVSSVEWSMGGTVVVNNSYGFDFTGVGFESNISNEFSTADIGSTEEGETTATSFSYTLAEDDDNDALSVDVYQYGSFSPIFHTIGGQTSNPYEGEVRTKYYEPDQHVLMEATMQIEVPQIDVDEPVVSDIPSGSVANYVLKLSNASEIGADVAYRIMLLDDTNENGAQLTMDGMPITGEGRLIKVPGNQTLTKALQLRQTDTGVLNYDNIGIVFASDSEPDDIFDDVYITAHFTPSSSAVDMALSNSIMNTQTGTNLKLTFNNFDRNYKNLKAFRLQYKKQGSTDWTQLHEYVLDENAVTQNNELLPEGANIDYTLDMNQFTDGDYLFRVLSVATYGNGEVYRSSEELALVKDMMRPRPLGQPEPADGVLSAGDELSVTFNETILKGELTQAANFKVTGVLNGADVAHETALSMQNTEAAAQTEADILLAGKDFSIDTWVNINGGAGTLLSHGKGHAKMSVGTDASNHLVVNIGSTTYTSDNTIPTGAWVFLTLSYGGGKLNATVAKDAEEILLFNAKDVVAYEGNGPLTVGKNMTGAIHELLLWDEAHDMTEALLQRSRTKNPATRHLIGYWKMDEGEGTTIRDYSRNRHMTMSNETWYMNNVNKAVSLADSKYLSIDASALPAYGEDDYALEFWMRGETQGAAQLLQMGQVGLWLNADGELQLTGKGAYLGTEEQTSISTTSGKLTDNAWHHIALNVLRQGAAAVYVDGVRRLTTNAANVGSIATNNLLVGSHRKTLSEHGEYSYDRAFTGQVDELRVWNATLSTDKLLSNRKVRLTGSEDGLVAYYPFETKQLDANNQVVTVGTAADLCGSGKTATVSSGELAYTAEAPALRTKQTEVNVPFTFVASDEKIVITIDEDPATIEGCTLNFTVRDVRDENGNYSAPAVWSAFVNKNQLVWAESDLMAELEQTNTTTLSATVVNNGGQQQMWTLSGMPAWLEASVESGETNPLSQTKVDFTVLPSAPLGRNEVTVYLRGNDDIDTPLTLNVKVTGNVPDWAVNPHDFESSMNVIGQLVIDNVVSEDADDILAAFIGEECRGLVHPQYNERYGGSYITMDIYGNTDETGKKDVTFRAYDASTGTTYPVVNINNTESVKFASLSLAGSYAEPKQFNVQNKIEQQIDLKAGWNWISFYVTADNMTIPTLFEKVADDVLTVKSQNSYLKHENSQWGGDLTGSLSNTEMYAVKMNADRKLRIVGSESDSKATIYEGWNWVGYNGRQAASLGDALASMNKADGDIVKAQSGVAYWASYEWVGSLLIMEPGKGYQIKSNAASQNVKAYGASQVSGGMSFTPVNFRKYPDNAIMAAKVVANGQSLSDIELGVFSGEECRAAAMTNADGIAFLTIPGDETCELTFKVAVSGEVVDAPLTLTYESNAEYGTPGNPIVLDLGYATGILVISDGEGDETIYDLSGRKLSNGKWSNGQMPKGVYIINGQKKTVK